MLIDTHCHLFAQQFNKDLDKVLGRAKEAGTGRIYLPNIDRDSIVPMLDLADKEPGFCFPSIGLHPCSVKENYSSELHYMEGYLDREKLSAIGETGVDLYWDDTTKDIQIASFRRHIEWAKQLKLPIIIHSRNALELTISEIQSAQDGSLSGIFHCFSGSEEQIRKIRDLGFHIGIGGVLTFKNSGLDKVVKKAGLENLVLETDAPYLAPSPYRGKRNEPAYVRIVAQKLAEVLELDFEEVEEETTKNALRVFK